MRKGFLTVLIGLAGAMSIVAGHGERECLTFDRCGAVVGIKYPDSGRTVHFIFTADSMFEGGNYALDVLKERGVKASFFFTGNFLRDSVRNGPVIRRAIDEGHYVGAHGDRHLLLADWDENRTTLVDVDSAVADMRANLKELAEYGVDTARNRIIVPSFEWYNADHIAAFRQAGFMPVSPWPSLLTYRDYTTPDMADYYASATLWDDFTDQVENSDLDGAVIILHLGTQDARTDKFYKLLPEMIDKLHDQGYKATRFTIDNSPALQ